MPRGRTEGSGGGYRERYSYRQGWEDPRLNEEEDYGNRGTLDYEEPHRDEDDEFRPWRRRRASRGRRTQDEEWERAKDDDENTARRHGRGYFRERESRGGSRDWPSYGAEYGHDEPPLRPHAHREPPRGGHFGRGPSGFRRSDERIREEICEQLWRDDEIDAREVSVDVHEGHVRLSGYVDDKQMKRDTEDLVEAVMGVSEISNELRIRKAE